MSPENERFLQQLVDHGRFANFDAALDAVTTFYRDEHQNTVVDLREKLEEAFEDERQGRVVQLDFARLKSQLLQNARSPEPTIHGKD